MKVILTFKGGKLAGQHVAFDDRDPIVVGTSAQADLSVDDDRRMAEEHFVIERSEPASHMIRDLGTEHGTNVNEARIEHAELNDGDVVRAGLTVLQVQFRPLEEAQIPTIGWTTAMSRTEDRLARGAATAEPAHEGAGEDDEFREAVAKVVGPAGYLLGRQVGLGAVARVYQATREADGGLAAIKVFDRLPNLSEHARATFLREMRVLEALHHPSIVRLLDVGDPDGELAWYAMEYVSGPNLHRLVRLSGAGLSPVFACQTMLQVLAALDHAHHVPPPEGPFVHRDVKPSNILVSGSGGKHEGKLVDFGLAKNFELAGQSGVTVTGQTLGTLPFMSREQLIDSKYVGPEVDLYAVGCVLYFCLCNQYVYDLAALEWSTDRISAILEQETVPIRQRCPGIPPALATVIDQSIARDPECRFRTAEEMTQAINGAMADLDLS